MNRVNREAFTLVEIVVSATILVILTSIGFYSYTRNISDARDSARITDLSSLESQLSLYKKKRGAFPFPWGYFNITNRWNVVAHQGRMDKTVALSTATNLPYDPELNIPYFYATTKNRQEYQLATSMENSDDPFSYLVWNYKSISIQVLPNILLALITSNETEINNAVSPWDTNRNLFIFHNGYHTLPYEFGAWGPYSDGSGFDTILADAQSDYWQNSDYRSCSEIEIAGKNITATGATDEYQVLSATGTLETVVCNGIL